ncbi:MAG: AbrB/MazE/SpoVT family DNA-binding domain-containing protein [Puniceicoccales bacterium]
MIKELKRVGNSHSITVDKALMDQMGVQAGSKLQLLLDGRNLVISPVDNQIEDDAFEVALESGLKQYDQALRNLA